MQISKMNLLTNSLFNSKACVMNFLLRLEEALPVHTPADI